MPSWDSDQYRRFERERTQPARDLCARIDLSSPRRIIDLGCGPGNSTAVLGERWPDATIAGLDSSAEMLATARARFPQRLWIEGDIVNWRPAETLDLIFSNAALQWVEHHEAVLPRLLSYVAPGGAFAFQVPADPNARPHTLIRELANSAAWRAKFHARPRPWHVHPGEFYYDVLSRRTARLELWTTDYLHVLESAAAIVEWYRGTGLRPWLDSLTDERDRTRFVEDYTRAIAAAYPPQHDGRVLFGFKRLFLVAYP